MKGTKQRSIPAYDAHYILERKEREQVKSSCKVCYVSTGSDSTRAIPLHLTQQDIHHFWLQQVVMDPCLRHLLSALEGHRPTKSHPNFCSS